MEVLIFIKGIWDSPTGKLHRDQLPLAQALELLNLEATRSSIVNEGFREVRRVGPSPTQNITLPPPTGRGSEG